MASSWKCGLSGGVGCARSRPATPSHWRRRHRSICPQRSGSLRITAFCERDACGQLRFPTSGFAEGGLPPCIAPGICKSAAIVGSGNRGGGRTRSTAPIYSGDGRYQSAIDAQSRPIGCRRQWAGKVGHQTGDFLWLDHALKQGCCAVLLEKFQFYLSIRGSRLG